MVYAVYMEHYHYLGINSVFGNIVTLGLAQSDEYFRTHKIVYVSDNWDICNQLCQEIDLIVLARAHNVKNQ